MSQGTGPFDDVEKLVTQVRQYLVDISRIKGGSGEFDSVTPDRAALHAVVVALLRLTVPNLDNVSVAAGVPVELGKATAKLLQSGFDELEQGLAALCEIAPDDKANLRELLLTAGKIRLLVDVWIHRVIQELADVERRERMN